MASREDALAALVHLSLVLERRAIITNLVFFRLMVRWEERLQGDFAASHGVVPRQRPVQLSRARPIVDNIVDVPDRRSRDRHAHAHSVASRAVALASSHV